MPPFLNNAFLIGLVAAALPILIHLFNRRPAQQVVFPSIEYLREITLKRVRRVRLREFLLLALRVLIIGLFALAMARPAIQGASRVARGSSTVAILLDNSWSLNAADPTRSGDLPIDASSGGNDDGTCLGLAKQRAEEVLDLMGEEDKAVLAFFGRPVVVPFQTPTANANLLRQELRKAPLSAGRADLGAAIDQVLPIVRAAHTLNKEIFVISDFQQQDLEEWANAARERGAVALRSGEHRPFGSALGAAVIGTAWADSTTGEGAATGEGTRGFELPDDIRIYLVPVRETKVSNVTLQSVRYDATGGASGHGRVLATVVNHGEEPVTERIVRAVAADGGSSSDLGDAGLSLPPLGQSEVEISLASVPADGAIEVRLGADLCEYDNRAYLVTGNSGARKVLLITGGGEVPGSTSSDDGLFIRTALDPTGRGEIFQVQSARTEILTDPAGWTADVVILANVGRLSEQAVENLGRFRGQGGGILITLGQRVDPRYYNTEVLGKLSSISLLNILADEGEGTYRSFRPTVLGHPVFSGFQLGPGQDLSSSRFRKIVECRIGSGARVLADWSGSLPALVEDNGLMLFTSSLDGDWNDFVTSASFLPFIHQATGYLAHRTGDDRGPQAVGSPLEATLSLESFQGQVTCVDPTGGNSPVSIAPTDRTARLRSERTTLPGIYRFVDGAGKRVATFAVNLDGKEGNLAIASKELQTRVFGRGAQFLAAGQRITRELLEGRYGQELWRPLLIAVLILLVVESLLARGKLLT
ncbi:MAG: BatA domain-containing protein [Candidatus Eisenbacteria bacterium]|nr:BatA domain-containing protein [Candidatus Eisenbacteria bacterium]